jgi:hypothetical protein
MVQSFSEDSSPFTRTIFDFPPSPISSKSFLKFLINTRFSSFLVLFWPPSISRKIRPQPKYLLAILLASNSYLFYWPTFCGSDSHSSDGVLLWHEKARKSSIYQEFEERFGWDRTGREIKDGASEGTRIFTKTLHHAKSSKSLLFCILFRCFPTLNGTLKRKVVTKTVTTSGS